MPAPYILARTLKEAHEFARDELGLGRGKYRVVTSPSTLSAVRGTSVYLVPGWERRYDRFAMRGALRWTRLEKVEVAEYHGEPDDLDPPGVQLTIDETDAFIATAYQIDPDLAAELEEVDDTSNGHNMESEGAPVKRRRRRCKVCGILVEPDEVEQHASEHLPEGDA